MREPQQEIGTIEAIKEEDVDPSVLKEVPLAFAKGNLVMPLRKEGEFLLAAVANGRGILALRDLSRHFGLRPRPVRGTFEAVMDAINRFYGQIGSAEEVMGNITGEDLSSVATEFEKPKDILELTEEAPIIRLLNAIMQQAVKERASDIHVEPYEKELEVRMRVDGILHRVLCPPKIIQDALISRVKIMANLDIGEKRLPQDGRIRLLIGGRDIDIRVSIVPTAFGERAVLRLLDRKQGLIGLWQVGLSPGDEKKLEDLLQRTNGILLVTGPTGSGKTTTLYAALNRIHTEEKNIITIEDPVEYQLKGIGQIHVNPRIGLTFASGLRSILRQDPDVIMVGEIRDFETAEIAVKSALTGHLVLSTIHTNDAPSTISRLLNMGIEPFLVSASVLLILAQRLSRKVCQQCKVEEDVPESVLLDLGFSKDEINTFKCFKGKGCSACSGTGYKGRIALYEVMPVKEEVKELILKGASTSEIKRTAVKLGMKTLRMSGLTKIKEGLTSIEEVLRVTFGD